MSDGFEKFLNGGSKKSSKHAIERKVTVGETKAQVELPKEMMKDPVKREEAKRIYIERFSELIGKIIDSDSGMAFIAVKEDQGDKYSLDGASLVTGMGREQVLSFVTQTLDISGKDLMKFALLKIKEEENI